MSREKILAKIRKCLALSASSNEHEAAAALRQARKLMEEYNVSDQDVDASRASECKAKAGVTAKPPVWESVLASRIGAAFGCQVVFSPGWSGRRAEWRFVGCGAAPEVAQYGFTVLLRQLKRARSEHIKAFLARCKTATKTRRADLFCEGWVRAVAGKIEAFAGNETEVAAVDAYMACHYPAVKELESTNRNAGRTLKGRELGDFYAGSIQGEHATLNRGVGGAEQRLALGGAA